MQQVKVSREQEWSNFEVGESVYVGLADDGRAVVMAFGAGESAPAAALLDIPRLAAIFEHPQVQEWLNLHGKLDR